MLVRITIKMNSKAKGGEFERNVCKALSRWVTAGLREDVFWRSAMSGGRATVKRGHVRQAGDICAVAPEGHSLTDVFYIECKHLRDISLDGLIKGNGNLLAIWSRTCKEAAFYERYPTLIFRQNHWPTMFCTNTEALRRLDLSPQLSYHAKDLQLLRLDELLSKPYAAYVLTPAT
jgi:hypothetical protein